MAKVVKGLEERLSKYWRHILPPIYDDLNVLNLNRFICETFQP